MVADLALALDTGLDRTRERKTHDGDHLHSGMCKGEDSPKGIGCHLSPGSGRRPGKEGLQGGWHSHDSGLTLTPPLLPKCGT